MVDDAYAERMLTGRGRIVRMVVSLVLALIASARAGGVALACELQARSSHVTMPMDHAGMADHDSSTPKSCDEPERSRECALMAACAPAVSSASSIGTSSHIDTERVAAAAVPEPQPVDRSPEPPPPRA